MSEYPTVNTLLGLGQLFVANELRVEDATEEVKNLLASVTLDKVFDQALWSHFKFFGLAEPDGDAAGSHCLQRHSEQYWRKPSHFERSDLVCRSGPGCGDTTYWAAAQNLMGPSALCLRDSSQG